VPKPIAKRSILLFGFKVLNTLTQFGVLPMQGFNSARFFRCCVAQVWKRSYEDAEHNQPTE
jgi:hypothetical protein